MANIWFMENIYTSCLYSPVYYHNLFLIKLSFFTVTSYFYQFLPQRLFFPPVWFSCQFAGSLPARGDTHKLLSLDIMSEGRQPPSCPRSWEGNTLAVHFSGYGLQWALRSHTWSSYFFFCKSKCMLIPCIVSTPLYFGNWEYLQLMFSDPYLKLRSKWSTFNILGYNVDPS